MPDDVIDAPGQPGNPSDTQPQQPAGAAQGAQDGDKPLSAGGGSDGNSAAPADWPADWRTKMAGEDADTLKALERYKSPLDVSKALREAQKKISSGLQQPALPENPTPEQVAEYRKQIGVPEAADGYEKALANGIVIGEDDKPLASSMFEAAHSANMRPEQVNAMLDWYYKHQENYVTEMKTADKSFRMEAEEDLRGEWGGDYRMIQNSVKNFLDAAPVVGQDEDGANITLGDMLRGARTPDGRLLGDNPAFLRWVADLSHKENPAGFVSPGAGGSQAQSIEEEIASIEKVMREKRDTYNKDEKMQKRYVQLLTAREKLAS